MTDLHSKDIGNKLNTLDARNKEPLHNPLKMSENTAQDKKFENERELIEQLNRKKFGTIRHSVDVNPPS